MAGKSTSQAVDFGWIKIHRKLLNHWAAKEPEFLAVWIRLMMEANHEDKKTMFSGALIDIKRGQLVYGRNEFSARSGVSVAKLRRIIKILISEHMISQQTTTKYSIISITKYAEYQGGNQQKTIKRPTNDQQTTTSKEVKETKEVKEVRTQSKLDFSSWPCKPDPQIWAEYLATRKKKKATDVSQTVVNQLGKELQKLASLGYSVDDCLAEMITRNWIGLKADWIHKGTGSTLKNDLTDRSWAEGNHASTRDRPLSQDLKDTSWGD